MRSSFEGVFGAIAEDAAADGPARSSSVFDGKSGLVRLSEELSSSSSEPLSSLSELLLSSLLLPLLPSLSSSEELEPNISSSKASSYPTSSADSFGCSIQGYSFTKQGWNQYVSNDRERSDANSLESAASI